MTDLLFTHASLDTFMSDRDNRLDVARLVDNLVTGEHRDYITLTETADPATVAMIREVATGAYQVVNPDDGDITFLVALEHMVTDEGGHLVIPAVHRPAREGGHGPRFVSTVTIRLEGNGDQVTHHGMHFVTKHGPGGEDRSHQQRRQARCMTALMREAARGRRLATGSGDLNTELPRDRSMQRIFDEAGLTTTSEETGVRTPTEGNRRIDYVWTRDADRRLVVKGMRVRRGAAWNSDHDPIDVWATIREAAK